MEGPATVLSGLIEPLLKQSPRPLHRQIAYEFTPSREQEWPQAFLKDYKGVLQVDA